MAYQYFIAHIEGAKKPQLYRTKQIEPKMRCTIPNSELTTEASTVVVRQREILVALGEKPRYGTVYGVLVEPSLFHVTNKDWGHIHFYVDMEEEQKERVLKAFRITLQRLKERNLVAWHPCTTEVRNVKGKELGHYAYRSNGTDTMILRPAEGTATREHIMVIGHEAAHGIWHRNMTSKDRASWSLLYQEYLAVKVVEKEDVKRIIASLRESQSVKDYAKSCDIAEKAELDIYLAWLDKVHKMSKFTVGDYLAAGEKLPRPDTHLFRSEIDTPVTNYGKTNVEEMFAEAMGLHLIGDLSNEKIKKKIERLSK